MCPCQQQFIQLHYSPAVIILPMPARCAVCLFPYPMPSVLFRGLLTAYAACSDGASVIAAQHAWMDKQAASAALRRLSLNNAGKDVAHLYARRFPVNVIN